VRKLFDGTVEIITPCFCAGANQQEAKIRAPSIRGELRWWFRALGGTREQEKAVFGGISYEKGDDGVSSSVVVRVSQVNKGNPIELPQMRINQPLSYLLYYANASGKARGQQHGPRFSKDGMIPPGSTFRLSIDLRKAVDIKSDAILKKAVKSFLVLGSLGYRSTRACGALYASEKESDSIENFISWAKELDNVKCAWVVDSESRPIQCDSWKSALMWEEKVLRSFRNDYPAGKNGNKHSPLGVSNSSQEGVDRQSSALRLRPLKLMGDLYALVYYCEAGLHPSMNRIDSLKRNLDSAQLSPL
jgi:CRISPR type III-B/RAMP module RAMP protein Cmr1